MDVYAKLKELGITLPPAPARLGVYCGVKAFGDGFLYVSGCGPLVNGQGHTGKLGKELSLEQGREAARACILNVLSLLDQQTGDLNRIKSFVKIIVFVSSVDDFYQQPAVANGATELLVEIFGEEIGCPARSAVSCNALPANIAVEIEALVELK